jgi:hypothetical protein
MVATNSFIARFSFVIGAATIISSTAVLSGARPAEAAPGGLQLPWPTSVGHNIGVGYTYNCVTHVGLDQYAIDFNFPSPVPVTAVWAGVAHLRPIGNPPQTGGNIVWIDHRVNGQALGFISLYAHLSAFSVADGQGVSQGDQIGVSGNSDPANVGYHLHFSMHSNSNTWWDTGNGQAYLPEPMSGFSGFGAYGRNLKFANCQNPPSSPTYMSTPPRLIPTVATNLDGRQDMFIATSANAYFTSQTTSISAPWNAWSTPIGNGDNIGHLAAARDANGLIELFSRGAEGQIWVNKQANANCSGTSSCFPIGTWVALPGVLASDPVVFRNDDGRLEIFAVGLDQTLQHTYQLANGSWTPHGWISLGGRIEGLPAVESNFFGYLEVFARATQDNAGDHHHCYHIWQTANGTEETWNSSGWQMMNDQDIASDPSALYNIDGTMEVFAKKDSADSHVIHTREQTAGDPTTYVGTWGEIWMSVEATPHAILQSDGRALLFGMAFYSTTNNALVYARQTTSGWTMNWGTSHYCQAGPPPDSCFGYLGSVPVVGTDDYFAGQVEIFMYGLDQVYWHDYTTTPPDPSQWSSWNHLVA